MSEPEEIPAPVVLGQGPEVELASGMTINVFTDSEAQWFSATRDQYLLENKFTEAADMRDLDRLLILELMVYRWTQHLAAGVDYEGHVTDERAIQRSIREYNQQINDLKKAMALNKAARTAAANEGNYGAWLTDLKARAKAFGVHRENQLRVALVLMNEVSAKVGSFLRADEEERVKLGFQTAEDVLKWIEEEIVPQYHEVDEHFRKNSQRYWVRDL